jgi:rhodanese-related sulfurtransferase
MSGGAARHVTSLGATVLKEAEVPTTAAAVDARSKLTGLRRIPPLPSRPMHTLQRHGALAPDVLAASLGDYVVIDVRERADFDRGHIPGSTHVPIDRLRDGWALPDLRLPVAVLGHGDDDAEAAAVLLAESGADVISVSGGAAAWRATGQCLVTNGR